MTALGRPRTPQAIAAVIRRYDELVRANTTADYDAVEAVALNRDGDIGWEVLDVAEEMGYFLTDDDRDRLWDAADNYSRGLRAERGLTDPYEAAR